MLDWAIERKQWNAEGRCARKDCSKKYTLADGRYQYPDDNRLLYCYECACLLARHQGITMLKLDEGSPDLELAPGPQALQPESRPAKARTAMERRWDYAAAVMAIFAPAPPPPPPPKKQGPLDRDCPACGAPPRRKCHSRTGKPRDPHPERKRV